MSIADEGRCRQLEARAARASSVSSQRPWRRRTTSRASPTKRRGRRTADEMDIIRGWIYATLCDDHPMTVRQVYYQLVSGWNPIAISIFSL